MAGDIEAELEAIKTLQQTLEPLAPEVRARVLDYVFRVLEIAGPPKASAQPAPSPTAIASGTAHPPTQHGAHADILSLKLEKQPTSANQMIALVAYHLAYEVPESERKTSISAEDVKKYFVQARYPMPKVLNMALANARNAGYLDPVDRGTYRLNSVGYNLVAHKLGGADTAKTSRPNRTNRKAKKGTKR